MWVRHEPERRAADPAAAAGRARGPIEALQRALGNRAVQRLLALQRAPTAEQTKEFEGYLAQGDWGRAAWVLNEWQPGDIADRIKNMRPTDLESLNEGAWHGGKGKVDAAVRARDSAAAIRGALRVLIWSQQWDKAATQLELFGHAAALAYVQDLLNQGKITGTQMRQLVKGSPSLQLKPGEAMILDKVLYVVYADTVRFDGDLASCNHNPGALKRPTPDIASWKYIGTDTRGFLIFPDEATGQRAAEANLVFKLSQDWTILEMMSEYASMRGDNPVIYAADIAKALGGSITSASKTKDVTNDPATGNPRPDRQQRIEKVKGVIFLKEKGKDAVEGKYDDPRLPLEVRDRLPPKAAAPAAPDAGAPP
ncbi:hypothetical protein J5X84_42830 [Streptosporangiaceae bacterium NEAU-GS5]|nr:hypothetical protein [Streptosporangiaceae bacterium NEAU-GS5]